jgi:hypothetical protein
MESHNPNQFGPVKKGIAMSTTAQGVTAAIGITDDTKNEVKIRVAQYRKGYQNTVCGGIVLYSDGNLGQFAINQNGPDFPGRKIKVVKDHRESCEHHKTNGRYAGNDAEVHVLNDLGLDILHWKTQQIYPTAIYLYVRGPHPVCHSCKHLIHKFEESFKVKITKEYIKDIH